MPYHYHIVAFLGGFVLDQLLGDPRGRLHPVCLMGGLTGRLEGVLSAERGSTGASERQVRRKNQAQLCRGAVLVLLVLAATLAVSAGVLVGACLIHPVLGMLVETVMTWQILAAKGLRVESMRVYHALREGLPEARRAVSMIVGRDTEQLDEAGVIRAAVETVAENTSDGIVAPMLYLALGGPILGFAYKAVNTMDSMVGYKNERYLYFGRAAARLDDVVNLIPSRVSAGLMLAACAIAGRGPDFVRGASAATKLYDVRRALTVYRRDRRKHASPNSAQTESVCAGALGVRLAGDARYFGKKVEKPYIGDALREIEAEDIVRANRLTALSAWLCEFLCLAVMGGILWLI